MFRMKLKHKETKAIPRKLFVAVRRVKDSRGRDEFILLEESDLVKRKPRDIIGDAGRQSGIP